MRSKHPLFMALLIVAALTIWAQPSDAQPRRPRSHGGDRGGAHVSAQIAVGVALGSMLGLVFDSRLAGWDAQWYPPYGYPPRGPYPPYRYRYVDNSAEVRVEVQPSSAEVYVDGYLAGNVSQFDGFFQRLYVSAGAHEIVVYQDGFRSLVRRVYFAPYSSVRIRERLQPLGPGELPEPRPLPPDDPQGLRDAPPEGYAPPPARETGVADQEPRRTAAADIVIDGELWQRAERLDRLVVSLPVGPHRVDVRKPGFVPFTSDITVKAGETVSLNVSLSERQ
jgi:hypothetical protein